MSSGSCTADTGKMPPRSSHGSFQCFDDGFVGAVGFGKDARHAVKPIKDVVVEEQLFFRADVQEGHFVVGRYIGIQDVDGALTPLTMSSVLR